MRVSLLVPPLVILAAALAACSAAPDPAPTPAPAARETVRLQSLTFPGHLWTPFMPPAADGVPTAVDAELSLPAGVGPMPAVILAHGCGNVTGAEKDWMPVGQCREYVARMQAAGRDVALFEYAGAGHGFDDIHTPPAALPRGYDAGRLRLC